MPRHSSTPPMRLTIYPERSRGFHHTSRPLALLLALTLLTGCSDGSTIEIGYIGLPPFQDTDLLVVELEWPGGGQRVTGADLIPGGGFGTLTPPIDVPTKGTLRIRSWLVMGESDTLGQVAGELRLDEGFTYAAFVLAGVPSPVGFCLTIADSVALLDPMSLTPAGDSLFLTLSGLPEGAVC